MAILQLVSILLIGIFCQPDTVVGLECLVYDLDVNYYGFITDPKFKYCMYTPDKMLDSFSAGGIGENDEDMQPYDEFMSQQTNNRNTTSTKGHVCFEETLAVTNSTRYRCMCNSDKCNSFGQYPSFSPASSFPDDFKLNDSITTKEYYKLMIEAYHELYKL